MKLGILWSVTRLKFTSSNKLFIETLILLRKGFSASVYLCNNNMALWTMHLYLHISLLFNLNKYIALNKYAFSQHNHQFSVRMLWEYNIKVSSKTSVLLEIKILMLSFYAYCSQELSPVGPFLFSLENNNKLFWHLPQCPIR